MFDLVEGDLEACLGFGPAEDTVGQETDLVD